MGRFVSLRRALAVTGVVIALAAAGTIVAFALAAGATRAEAPTVHASPSGSGQAEPVSAADFCYVESMIFYGVAARALGEVVLEADGVSPEVRTLASEVVAREHAEIAELRELYVAWSDAKPLERPDQGPCAGHGAHADMPGVPTWSERSSLAAADGVDAETRYVALMLSHSADVFDLAEDTLAGHPHSIVRAIARETAVDTERVAAALRALAAEG